jgi:hypothetical protein
LETGPYLYDKKQMNDMANYLTTKNRLLVAILAFILPFVAVPQSGHKK